MNSTNAISNDDRAMRASQLSNAAGAGVPTQFALPTGSLLVSIIVSVLLVAGGWATAASLMKDENAGGVSAGGVFLTGMVGIGVVGVMSILGVVVMTPWKSRTMIDWMTMWFAGTVFRVLVTPVAAYVLYSALSPRLSAKSLALSVAITYMIALFVEAVVLSTYLKRYCPPLPGSPHSSFPRS
jgi:hypothetical protein